MREAVGLFNDMDKLQAAVKELESTEFPRDAISVLGNQQDIEEKFGIHTLPSELAEVDPDVPHEAPVRSEEKTIGAGVLIGASAYIGAMGLALAAGAVTIPAIIAAAAIGSAGGGAAGGILAKVLGDHFDASIEHQIENGGLLLWVRTESPEKERKASEVLTKYGATNVKIHET